jgi:type II secretory pathway pseudopilin PulG
MSVLVIALLLLAGASTVLMLIAKTQVTRADHAEQKAASYAQAYRDLDRRAVRLADLVQTYNRIAVQKNEERQELAETDDSDLVHRANGLFSGMQDNKRSQQHTGNE